MNFRMQQCNHGRAALQGQLASGKGVSSRAQCRSFVSRGNTPTRRHVAVHAMAEGQKPVVVLTREAGKNDKMATALTARGMHCVELPLIEHTAGEDRPKLPGMLQAGGFDYVAITSPEAATVFLEAWEQAGKPQVRIAVVGAGTGEVLKAAGVTPAFTPSKALGKTMGSELPHIPGGNDQVLYPASAKASTDLQDSLTAAGFKVTRLHTYNTAGVKTAPAGLLAQAAAAPIVTFGSPSAVKAWVALVGKETAVAKASVCIGSTSAKACEAQGLSKVYYPQAPGIEGWVASVEQAAQELGLVQPATTNA